MMQTDVKLTTTQVLGEMNKAGIAVLEDIIYKFLYNAENDQLLIGMEAFAVVVKATAGVHATRTADLLKEVINSRFKPKVFKGGWHQAVGDITDQLYRIVNDLFGIVNALQLGGLVEVDQVFVQVKPGGSQ